jgi:pyrroline-5-carboxylate reductase
MSSIVLLGGGRITSALIAGLRLAKFPGRIVVHDCHPKKLRRLQREFGAVPEPDLHHAVAAARILLIAVRPPSLESLLRQIGRIERTGHPIIAVSLAAGVPLAKLRKRLGPRVAWARAMPSPACRYGRGLTAVAFDRSMTKRARGEIRRLFRAVGPVLEIPEKQFDAFTVTYSVSHGYHALATLAAAAEKAGLPRKIALLASAHALADGIVSWREHQTSVPHLLKEAATPGGVAATILAAMDEAGYREIVARALRTGLARTRSLGKL